MLLPTDAANAANRVLHLYCIATLLTCCVLALQVDALREMQRRLGQGPDADYSPAVEAAATPDQVGSFDRPLTVDHRASARQAEAQQLSCPQTLVSGDA